jgi:non-specific serine/threonine protein kinase
LRDLGAVRLRDLASPERVFQLLHADLADDFPPLRSLDATPNNLPQQLSSFVGRERDIAELRRLLRTSRMLTLTGAGGIGKSRLSLQVAAEALTAYPDGVWLVELAATSDPARVENAVAGVLGVRETAGLAIAQALAAHLASRTLLLILDNCEHLVEACARIAGALLRAAPGLAVLATSRESLRIHGEQTYPLSALSLPPSRTPPSARSAGDSEAIRLFVERARQQQPAFALNDRNAPVVAAICARLDGIPLALELAAARVRAMSVDDVNARLADRFALLTGGDRAGLPRQQTLRALVDWSYDLLDDSERVLFNRLAVFAAGFDLEAVERVCAAPPLADTQTLDLLSALVDKSLVTLEPVGQRPRYAQLETLREYGRGRGCETADAARDLAATRARHAAHYLALARAAHRELVGAEQASWCDRLAAEHDNLHAAFVWALTEGATTATANELGAALYRYWHLRGHLTEGRELLRDALALPGENTEVETRAGALYAAGVLAFYQGDLAEARSMLTTCLALRRRVGSPGDIAAAQSSLANVLQNEGDTATARDHQQQALVLFRELGNRAAEGICLINLGSICNQRSEYQAACGYLEEATLVGRSTGHGPLEGMSESNLGELFLAQDNPVAARARFQRSLEIARRIGDRALEATSIAALGRVESDTGEQAGAERMLGEALLALRALGLKAPILDALGTLAGVRLRSGSLADAVRLRAAVDAARSALALPAAGAELVRRDREVAHARAAMGEVAFAEAWAGGAALSVDQAIAVCRTSSRSGLEPGLTAPT